ncbi:MAG: serine/threonine-protein kinase [Myxococcota bacterium]
MTRSDPPVGAHGGSSGSSRPAERTVSVTGGLYVDSVFDAVAQLAPAERELEIGARCAGHPTVEAEVRALLKAYDAGGEPPAVPTLAPGARIGRYRLEQRIGSGATASVWKAFDHDLHSYTALKLLHPDGRIRGAMALDAVMREARAASAIISDHVVRIKTAGRFDGGPHFVEMELCAEHRPGPAGTEVLQIGQTLAEAELESLHEAVRVVAEAARGVEAAHRAGVLHRDLKPGNILLTPVSRRAKVTDFGLAADQIFPEPTERTPATATVTVMLDEGDGRVVGTPAYMSPEQALGHPPTRTGDVYALGATLYALVARRAPYEPTGEHQIPAFDVLAQVRGGPPDPLGQVVRVPRRLARLVEKAMARAPRDRYPTALAFAHDLDAFVADRPTTVDGAAPLLRVWLFARRNRQLVASALALAVMLVVFAAALGWLDLQRRDLVRAIDAAEVRKADAEHAATAASALRDQMLLVKDQALREAQAAELARQLALTGQSDAEARARDEIEKRRLADEARGAAELAQVEAETARALAEMDRDAAFAAATAADERATEAAEAEAVAAARAEAEAEAKLAAQRAATELERNIALLEERIGQLEASVTAHENARAEAEAEVARLQEQLRGYVPQPP